MRRPLVAGNWKMNGTAESSAALARAVVKETDPGWLAKIDVALCPSFIFLSLVRSVLSNSGIALGGQSVSEYDSGAYTGEVSSAMLRDVGCAYALVGHSERRGLFGESDTVIAAKFGAARKEGLIPILCVGERLEEREGDVTEEVVGRQLDAVIRTVGVRSFAPAVIAYEPVWAIGTGKTATPKQAEAAHSFIRGVLRSNSEMLAVNTRILYGGSVKAENAADLFRQPNVDGGLIGGAALDAREFLSICKSAGDSL